MKPAATADTPLLALVHDAEKVGVTGVAGTPVDAEIVAAGLDPEAVKANPFRRIPEPKPDPDFEFWDEAKQDGLVIQERADRVAVYRTARDQVAIRSESIGYDDGDPTIVIDPKNIDALIGRLRQLRDEIRQ